MTTYIADRQWTPTHATLLLAVAMEPKEIGQRIKAARNARDWTQLQMALEANVSPSSIQRWESGHLPPVRELMRIAELLDVDPEQLVELAPTGGDQLVRLEADFAEVQLRLARMEEMLQEALAKRGSRKAQASG